jgi:hypothetical protein
MATFRGRRGAYFWVTDTDLTLQLSDVLAACPELVLDKFVVISAFDSGILSLTPDELASGWQPCGGLACSPRISAVSTLPQAEYEEWYIFKEFCIPVIVDLFVNYSIFSLRDPVDLVGVSQDNRDALQKLQTSFWSQIHEVTPETYIGFSEYLTIVTVNENLFNQLTTYLA